MPSFDTPQTGSTRSISVSGTIAPRATLHTQLVYVISGTPSRTAHTFYRVVNFVNTSSLASFQSGTYAIAIVPKIESTQTATPTVTWSY